MLSLLLPCVFVVQAPTSNEPPPSVPAVRREDRAKSYRRLVDDLLEDDARGRPLGWGHFAPMLLNFAKEDPTDRFGFDCLMSLILKDAPHDSRFDEALDQMVLHHLSGRRIADLCAHLVSPQFFGSKSGQVERLFRLVLEGNPIPDQRAEAAFGLAQFLKNKSRLARCLKGRDGARLERRLEAAWGTRYVAALTAADAGELHREGDKIFRISRPKYAKYWEGRPLPGRQAPEIQGEDLHGNAMSLRGHLGKVVVLSFWGFGCAPCRAMFPQEKSLVSRLEHEPFVLLGVNADRDRATVRRLVSEEGLTWRSWWDGGDTKNPISVAWHIRFWPSVLVIDKEGTIRYRNIEEKSLDIAVESLLLEQEGHAATDGGGTPARPSDAVVRGQSHVSARIIKINVIKS